MKLAIARHAMWPSPSLNKVGVPDWFFEAPYPRLPVPLFTLRRMPRGIPRKT